MGITASDVFVILKAVRPTCVAVSADGPASTGGGMGSVWPAALARAITSPDDRTQALAQAATAAAQAGDPDRAEALACAITDPGGQAQVLAGLARAAAQAGDPDRAEALARAITSPYYQAQTLAQAATAAAQAGDPNRASRLAADAEALARAITDRDGQARALAELARAAAQAGDPDRARHLLALALSVDSSEIPGIEVVSQFFPSVVRGAGGVFVSAYKAGM